MGECDTNVATGENGEAHTRAGEWGSVTNVGGGGEEGCTQVGRE